MDSILDFLSQFKKQLIIGGILIAALLFLTKVFPVLQDMKAHKTPIAEITAENEKIYKNQEEILPDDFVVTAIHEDGAETPLDSSEVELSKSVLDEIGNSSIVTLTYKEDTSIYCNVKLSIEREKVIGFQCGYPDVKNVIAVLYSNGELCFEGSGDTLTFYSGEYPWQSYSGDYAIRYVTFEDTVKPRVMDGWFSGMADLTYIGAIPDSVQSMKNTFSGCESLSTMADWTKCSELLDITGCYSSCYSLKYTVEVPEHVTRASSAFANCPLLQKTPNLSKAISLANCQNMFEGCTKLVSITMPPNAINISAMFANCMNLQIMPSIPDSVINMSGTFSGCSALKTLASIPRNVDDVSDCFNECEFIIGDCEIDANPTNLNGMFSGACTATTLNLTGSSIILDAFANTSDSGNVLVNGKKPIPEITSMDAYYQYLEQIEEEKAEREEDNTGA